MIGIYCKESEKRIAIEFFELFKINWEFYNQKNQYEAIICTDENIKKEIKDCKLVIIFSILQININNFNNRILLKKNNMQKFFNRFNHEFFIYNDYIVFENNKDNLLYDKEFKNVGVKKNNIIWLGYNLFKEVEYLLSTGQPAENALTPSLDSQICFLRELLKIENINFCEILPKPDKYNYITALTHDVDFCILKNHKFDIVYLGFLYKSTVGTLKEFFKGRKSFFQLLINFFHAFISPLVFINLYRDFWNNFNKYIKIEKGYKSTFYLIPFKEKNGMNFENNSNNKITRKVRYDVDDINKEIQRMESLGFEIGVHGIDSWCDKDSAIMELERIKSKLSDKAQKIGTRIHWLALNKDSFNIMEDSNYYYDSTFGYNETVGFKSGSSLVYKCMNTKNFYELPMHLQDTALFYPKRLNLSIKDAWGLFLNIIKKINENGGVFTILYHMRSIGPDRLWQNFYKKMLKYLNEDKAWITTARNAVMWFEKRRSFVFRSVKYDKNNLSINYSIEKNENIPALILCCYSNNNQKKITLNENLNEIKINKI